MFETTTAGVTIQSPQLDINTVAAGGGSRLFWRNGLFVVGPESAGAHPGPACYRKGGPLTVTDANLFLGRLLPDFFPKIFGRKEDEGLDEKASEKLFQELTETINTELSKDGKKKPMSADEVAYGFIKIANETMTRPIRSLTEAKGHDTSKHRLATFGGAGGQHAVAIAESLGIRQILLHRYSSVLSAYGMALADVVDERQEPESKVWSDGAKAILQERMEDLKAKSREALRVQGFEGKSIVFEEYLNMRYRGTESALMVIKPDKEVVGKCHPFFCDLFILCFYCCTSFLAFVFSISCRFYVCKRFYVLEPISTAAIRPEWASKKILRRKGVHQGIGIM